MTRYLFVAALLLAAAPSARAVVILDSGHVDLAAGYDGDWEVHVHDHTNDEEHDVADVVIRVNNIGIMPRPAGSQFDFIGVTAGTPIWRVTDAGFPLTLGVGAEENTPGIFDTYTESDLRLGSTPVERTAEWIRMTVKDFSGPGHMSIWASDIGGPIPFVATADGIDPSDVLFAINGSHADMNWAFTEAGTYELTLEASAFIGGVPTFSGDYTFTFEAQPVPEPTSLALAGLAGIGAGYRRWRTSRKGVRG